MSKATRGSKFEILGSLTWPVAGLALLLLFNAIFNRYFFGSGYPLKVLVNASVVAVVGLGMTLVIATGGVDLSVGVVMAIGGAAAAYLLDGKTQPWLVLGASVGAGLLAGAVCGAWNGFLVSVMRIQPIIATLVFMVAGRGIAELLASNKNMAIVDPHFISIWYGSVLHVPGPILIAAGMLILTGLLTRKTALGLFIEAVGDNPVASRYAGINARLVLFMVYVFAGISAGLGGVMQASSTAQLNPFAAGLNMELDAILAAVVGGTSLTGGKFSLVGTIIGAVVIESLTQTLLMIGVPSDVAPLPKGLAILAVCMLQSPTFRASFGRIGRIFSPRGA